MELLNLDSINSYPNWEWILRRYSYYERPTFYFCIPSHLPTAKCKPICACAVDMWSHRGGGGGLLCEYECVCAHVRTRASVCVSVYHSHHVQPYLCVSGVDVPKWGHFLSVWCLRNNPTAQKLLQPSASTYSSLYLYWSGYAFSVWLSSYSRCLVLHDSTLSQQLCDACFVAHNMRFWFYF